MTLSTMPNHRERLRKFSLKERIGIATVGALALVTALGGVVHWNHDRENSLRSSLTTDAQDLVVGFKHLQYIGQPSLPAFHSENTATLVLAGGSTCVLTYETEGTDLSSELGAPDKATIVNFGTCPSPTGIVGPAGR